MLIYLSMLNLFVHGSLVVMSPLLPEIADEIHLTNTQIGVIWGAWPFGMLFFSIIGGSLGDRFGVKKVVAACLPLAALLSAARGFCYSFETLAAVMFLLGVTLGLLLPNLTKGVGIWFPSSELGRAQGILLIGASGGLAISTMLSASVLSPLLHGWRNVMSLSGVILLVLFIFWVTLARERPRGDVPSGQTEGRSKFMQGFKKVSRVRDVWYVAVIELSAVGTFIAYIGLFPKIMVDRGMDPGMAGIYLSIMVWATCAFHFIGPFISDKVGFRKSFILPFLVIFCIALVGQGFSTGGLLVFFLVLMACGYGSVVALTRTVIFEIEGIGPSLAGTAMGIIFTLNRLGGWLIPIAMGGVLDVTSFLWAPFLLIAALNLIAAILSTRISETGWRARAAA